MIAMDTQNIENCAEINKDDTIANQAKLKKAQAKLKSLEAIHNS